MPIRGASITFAVEDYDLNATLASGQAFRWRQRSWSAGADSRLTNRVSAGARTAMSARFETHARTDKAVRAPSGAWEGVVGQHWVRLSQTNSQRQPVHFGNTPHPALSPHRMRGEGGRKPGEGCPSPNNSPSSIADGYQANCAITAEVAKPVTDWCWLSDYLQVEVDLAAVLKSFPDDEPMRAAVAACRGLRLLRQDPWECLASFILSSTKQIVQIQQIVALLCERFGEPVGVSTCCRHPADSSDVSVERNQPPICAFPSFQRIASLTEADLRACKMGFRAPYLLGTAQLLARGEIRLEELAHLSCEQARAELLRLPGVGRKIADCVLLFAFGFQEAFPIDVWVMRALRELYFPRRRVSPQRLQRFSAEHFGPNGGYAQQYLFHYMRTRGSKFKVPGSKLNRGERVRPEPKH